LGLPLGIALGGAGNVGGTSFTTGSGDRAAAGLGVELGVGLGVELDIGGAGAGNGCSGVQAVNAAVKLTSSPIEPFILLASS
jgi:hypothetical protein